MQTPTAHRNKLITGLSDGCPPPLPMSIIVRPTLYTLTQASTIVSPVDSPSAFTKKVPKTVSVEKSPYLIKALPQQPRLHSVRKLSHASDISSCPESPMLEPRPFGPKSFIKVVADSTGFLEDNTLTKSMSNTASLYECLRPLLNPLFEEDFNLTPGLFFHNTEENDACFMNNFHDIDPLPFEKDDALMVASSDVPSRRSTSSTCTTKEVRLRASHLEQWDQRFKELAQFRMENGHALVPLHYPANPRLSHWVKRQRCQYKLKCEGKHNTLTDQRQELLEDMGFVWDSHTASWESKFNELCNFKQVHGHSFVPTMYPQNPQLAAWIKCQRRQLRIFHGVIDAPCETPSCEDVAMKAIKSTLSAERVHKLLQSGLRWKRREG